MLQEHIEEIGEDLFHSLYRVTVHQFRVLCDMLQPFLKTEED